MLRLFRCEDRVYPGLTVPQGVSNSLAGRQPRKLRPVRCSPLVLYSLLYVTLRTGHQTTGQKVNHPAGRVILVGRIEAEHVPTSVVIVPLDLLSCLLQRLYVILLIREAHISCTSQDQERGVDLRRLGAT